MGIKGINQLNSLYTPNFVDFGNTFWHFERLVFNK